MSEWVGRRGPAVWSQASAVLEWRSGGRPREGGICLSLASCFCALLRACMCALARPLSQVCPHSAEMEKLRHRMIIRKLL